MAPTPIRIFVSYARSDAAFVLRIAQRLRADGLNVWIDQLDIPKGARWDEEIGKALEACTCQLVVLSPASISSQNVMDEVSFALDEKKTVIPILYQQCAVPFRLKRVQYVDFTGNEGEAYRQLLAAITGTPSPAAPIAPEHDGGVPVIEPSPAPTPLVSTRAGTPAPPHKASLARPLAIGSGIALAAVASYVALSSRQGSAPAEGQQVVSTDTGKQAASATAPSPPTAIAPASPAAAVPAAVPIAENPWHDYVVQYLAAQGRGNATELLAYYADRVDFFDQQGADHDFILKDKTAYYRRWPDVQKTLAGPVLFVRNGQTTSLSFTVRYVVSNASRGDKKSGMVRQEIVLHEINGKPLIVSEHEQTLAANAN